MLFSKCFCEMCKSEWAENFIACCSNLVKHEMYFANVFVPFKTDSIVSSHGSEWLFVIHSFKVTSDKICNRDTSNYFQVLHKQSSQAYNNNGTKARLRFFVILLFKSKSYQNTNFSYLVTEDIR